MIILLDTSTPVCRLTLIEGDFQHESTWRADRLLAKRLLAWLEEQLHMHDKRWQDIDGIGVFSGPGSFTGLRVGLTVMNTLAEGLSVPIVAARGTQWQSDAQNRLQNGENDHIALPYYAYDANITTQRK